jgi:hypothetical protein
MMIGGGIKAREPSTGKFVYLRFTSQNTAGLVFRKLPMKIKLELDHMMQGPKAPCCFTHGGPECSLCGALYILS